MKKINYLVIVLIIALILIEKTNSQGCGSNGQTCKKWRSNDYWGYCWGPGDCDGTCKDETSPFDRNRKGSCGKCEDDGAGSACFCYQCN